MPQASLLQDVGKPAAQAVETGPAQGQHADRRGAVGGQAGCIGAPQTVMNAVLDALRPLGVTHLDMPATPAKVWRAIRDARIASA